MKEPTIRNPLAPGLYFVATPIGNARDITLRALDVLADADVLLAEDTRNLRHLMEIHGIPLGGRRVLPYHDHNGAEMRPRILDMLAEGRSIACASDAGTPLVADPGFALARAVQASGHTVHVVPGASAALAALTLAGLPSDRFLFAGFPPSAAGARRRFLEDLSDVEATLILFESPRRLGAMLAAASEALGVERQAAVCRELTKKFEETIRGSLAELAERFAAEAPRGEIVVCIDRPRREADRGDWLAALEVALETARLKEAATEIAERFGVSRRDVYQAGLDLKSRD